MDLMKALSSMYEKPLANNKVHLMKKFNLKKAKGTLVVQHLNEFNMITNQLSQVEIEFDDVFCALILLAFLPNSWEIMRMAVSNSVGKSKLIYDDLRFKVKRFAREMRIQTMYKIKLLSQRIRVEVEAKDLMIENSIVGHNQEIDLCSKKLENASIMGKIKMAT